MNQDRRSGKFLAVGQACKAMWSPCAGDSHHDLLKRRVICSCGFSAERIGYRLASYTVFHPRKANKLQTTHVKQTSYKPSQTGTASLLPIFFYISAPQLKACCPGMVVRPHMSVKYLAVGYYIIVQLQQLRQQSAFNLTHFPVRKNKKMSVALI